MIIPAINEAERIGRAVESARTAGAAEVIVSDGGSRDQTETIARSLGARWVTGPAGRGGQQNRAAAESTSSIILFLHADNWLAATAIEQIELALRDPRRLWGAFRQRIDAPETRFRWLESGNALRLRWQRLAYGDQAIFVRRHIFERVRGFPEIPLMEDVVFSKRLGRLARPILLPGPVFVDPRRWREYGVLRQTIRNWWLMARWRWGARPEDLARAYRRHDRNLPAPDEPLQSPSEQRFP